MSFDWKTPPGRSAGLLFAAALALGAMGASPARAASTLLDFEGFAHGTVIDDEYSQLGVNILVENFHKDFGEADDGVGDDPDWGVIFNSTLGSTADADLQGPQGGSWAGGNLANDTVLGNLLIIQENIDGGCNGGTLCSRPDDEAGRPAGRIIFDFAVAVESFGFDLVDVEGGEAKDGSVRFFFGGSELASLGFLDLGLIFGDNTANRVDPIDALRLGLASDAVFDRVVIELGGSAGIDNATFTPVPEPGSAGLLALGLLGLARRRR